MPSYKETRQYIKSLTKMGDGWCYGEGKAPSEMDARIMDALLLQARLLGFEVFEAFPGVDGEIQLAIHDEENFYAITIEPDALFTVSHRRDNVRVSFQEGFSFHDVIAALEEFAFHLCNTFELSTRSKSLNLTVSLAISPLRSPVVIKVFPVSYSSALSFAMGQSADTSPPTMANVLRAIRSSIGSFQTVPC